MDPDPFPMPLRNRPLLLLIVAVALCRAHPVGAKPVEFEFVAPDNAAVQNPYARELWAEVVTPGGQKLALPAYYADGGLYAVHARPEEVGTYKFGSVSESTLGARRTDLVVSMASPREVQVAARTRLPSILINPKDPRQFSRSDGLPFIPVGANLAWAPDESPDTVAYYENAFPAFSKANLNWMRIWTAHWDGLNLDWLPPRMGPSPKPGMLSEEVARRWDQIFELAEENGVYVQMVLQYHGQYTTYNDSNWSKNPWNAANPGGFLKSPEDFFTDANAQLMTVLKYRYIIARWGWSPAIIAWELFNEVHWTNSFRNGHEADVARWHSAMATAIRQLDTYGHLVTTSTENLRSPIYEKLDYYQPHLYASDSITAARTFALPYSTLDRPAFYGEEGDDHEALSEQVKKSGVSLVPPIWASAMGQGSLVAEPWDGWQILAQNRLGELGAVFRFLAINRVAMQQGLVAFSDPVDCADKVALRMTAGEAWQRMDPATVDYPLDGSIPLEAANLPATLVGSDASRADGFPDRVTYRLDLPKETSAKVIVGSMAAGGGGIDVRVDGNLVASHRWAGGTGAPDPGILEFLIPAGPHSVLLQNPGPDWIGVSAVELATPVPVLAMIGRRNDHFIEGWVWHRQNIYAEAPSTPSSGVVLLRDVPAGSWKVTWWNTEKGVPLAPSTVAHPGGTLKLQAPQILRHAAFVLTRGP